MRLLSAAWSGKERLWKVFWLYYVLGLGVLSYLPDVFSEASRILKVPVGVAVLVYLVWAPVSVWRCAFNADQGVWGYVVRALLVAQAIVFVMVIVVGVFQ